MAVKTITIDMRAYDLLARQKRAGESFSDVIKDHFGPQKTAAGLLRALPSIGIRDDTLDRVERRLKARKRHPARAPRL